MPTRFAIIQYCDGDDLNNVKKVRVDVESILYNTDKQCKIADH